MVSFFKKILMAFLFLLTIGFLILFFSVFNVSFNDGFSISFKDNFENNKIIMMVTGNTGNSYTASTITKSSGAKSNIDISDVKVTDDNFLNLEDAILKETNNRRAQYNLKPLTYSAAAENVAKAKTKEMYLKNYFEHTSPYSGDLKTQFSKWGSIKLGTNATIIGENIIYMNKYSKNEITAKYLVDQWMNSEKHRENILNTQYTQIGIAVYYGDDTRCYAAQEFVTPIN